MRWLLLVPASIGVAGLLDYAGIGSALLLGAMISGVIFATRGMGVLVPPPLFVAAQAMVGCLIASSIDLSIGATLVADWELFLGVTLATIAASSTLGYALSRWRIIEGSVAIWGSSPGGATAMVVMAQAYGADVRLVAVMVYTRVVAVAITASLLSLLFVHHAAVHRGAWTGLGAVDPGQLAITLAVAAIGAIAGRALRIPAGALIVPLVLGIVLNGAGIVHIAPPHVLLALAYLVVGWRIGLAFTRDAIAAAARALPPIILAALLLIAFCGGLAMLLVRTLGIDPFTAYLATSPGGMDSVAIIAASGTANLSFVMALQMFRFTLVMLIGPALATALAKREQARTGPHS